MLRLPNTVFLCMFVFLSILWCVINVTVVEQCELFAYVCVCVFWADAYWCVFSSMYWCAFFCRCVCGYLFLCPCVFVKKFVHVFVFPFFIWVFCNLSRESVTFIFVSCVKFSLQLCVFVCIWQWVCVFVSIYVGDFGRDSRSDYGCLYMSEWAWMWLSLLIRVVVWVCGVRVYMWVLFLCEHDWICWCFFVWDC